MPPARIAAPSVHRHGRHGRLGACVCRPSRAVHRALPQHGSGLIEFSIVAVPILLLGLGSIEAAHWLLTRQVVSLALLEAGRAGISNHANPQGMASAFEQALLPLFPATRYRSARENQQQAFELRKRELANAAWQIMVLSPSSAAFDDFADPALHQASYGGSPAINNNYQREQDQRYRALGWPDGLGPLSGQSIYQANTLVLRLSYPHKPVLPGLRGLIRMLGKSDGTYSQRAMAQGYLPFSREISLTMQSHPVRWPTPGDGHVVRPGAHTAVGNTVAGVEPCAGLWCLRPLPAQGSQAGPASSAPLPGTTGQQGTGAMPSLPVQEPAGTPGTDELAEAADDPACGLTLCCAPA